MAHHKSCEANRAENSQQCCIHLFKRPHESVSRCTSNLWHQFVVRKNANKKKFFVSKWRRHIQFRHMFQCYTCVCQIEKWWKEICFPSAPQCRPLCNYFAREMFAYFETISGGTNKSNEILRIDLIIHFWFDCVQRLDETFDTIAQQFFRSDSQEEPFGGVFDKSLHLPAARRRLLIEWN